MNVCAHVYMCAHAHICMFVHVCMGSWVCSCVCVLLHVLLRICCVCVHVLKQYKTSWQEESDPDRDEKKGIGGLVS